MLQNKFATAFWMEESRTPPADNQEGVLLALTC